MENDRPPSPPTDGMPEMEDAILLREFTHRTGNEMTMAIAALRLVTRAAAAPSPALVASALERLETTSALHRFLARPVPASLDVAGEIASLSRLLTEASPALGAGTITLNLPECVVEGALARRLVLVAAELIGNAARHAMTGRRGRLTVSLAEIGGDLSLVVQDDGGCGVVPVAGRPGTGHGTGIMAGLVARAGGRIDVETGPSGTTARVLVPVPRPADQKPP